MFKQANITADSDQTKRILGDAIREIKQRSASPPIRKRPFQWRRIMRSKKTQLSTAAIILLALGLILSHISEPVVYGMPEIPALYELAQTLHLKGTRYFPESNSSQTAQVEVWIDLANNCWRTLAPSYSTNGREVTVFPTEMIHNGQGIMMVLDHAHKQVGYYKLSPLQQALQERKQVKQWRRSTFGDPSMYDAYGIIDNETIDGIAYEIWEAVVTQHSSATVKMQTWLDPRTGNLLKAKTWRQFEEGQWQLSSELSVIERDLPIPPGIFQMAPVSDYDAICPPDAAPPLPIGARTIGSGNWKLSCYLLFALPDGSLVSCWSSPDKRSSESQRDVFAGLRPGAVLPELPYKIHAIKALLDEKEVVFSGCHLTYTQKAGQYYEWGLYVSPTGVPNERLHTRNFLLDYQAIEAIKGRGQIWSGIDAVIETEQQFNDLIVAAMAEFSDEGAAAVLTLKEILALAGQKRGE